MSKYYTLKLTAKELDAINEACDICYNDLSENDCPGESKQVLKRLENVQNKISRLNVDKGDSDER